MIFANIFRFFLPKQDKKYILLFNFPLNPHMYVHGAAKEVALLFARIQGVFCRFFRKLFALFKKKSYLCSTNFCYHYDE